jgi:predicted 3-demethylubiquinone-9 3-methyltransferase (glyoxalase superfamily)
MQKKKNMKKKKIKAEPGKQKLSITKTQKISPFLWFDGEAEEAANFYVSVFSAVARNSKIVSMRRLGDERGGIVMTTFQLAGQKFMALDGGPQFTFSPATSFFVDCKSQEEVDHLWDKLSDGGEKQRCGWLKDKYGLSWQIVPTVLGKLMGSADPVRAKNVLNAMLQMDKIDIKKLEQAYDQK